MHCKMQSTVETHLLPWNIISIQRALSWSMIYHIFAFSKQISLTFHDQWNIGSKSVNVPANNINAMFDVTVDEPS